MARFGRPLFGVLLRANPDNSYYVFGLARAKLVGISDPDSMRCDDNGRLAVFAVRLLLDLNTAHFSTRARMARLVEMHMAIVYSIPADRKTIYMGYPSEPLLAEAAAQQMHHFCANYDRSESQTLLQFVDEGLVEREVNGELVARLLFMRAYDCAIEHYYYGKTEWAPSIKHHPDYSKGDPLTYFIKALFTERYAEVVLKSKPDNVKDGLPFEEAFKDAWVRFTHFQRAGNTSVIKSIYACGALARGMAFQCCASDPYASTILPVFFRHDENGEEVCLCEQNTSLVGVQVNNINELTPYGGDRPPFDEEDIGFFPADAEEARPYVVFSMNLSGSRVYRPTATVGEYEACQPECAREGKDEGKGKDEAEPQTARVVHPRCSIFAYGCTYSCTKDVYGVMDDDAVFAGLLNREPEVFSGQKRGRGLDKDS